MPSRTDWRDLLFLLLRMHAGGLGLYLLILPFATSLWRLASAPILEWFRRRGFEPRLVQVLPMEGFTAVWIQAPLLVAAVAAAPWVLYQLWRFIGRMLGEHDARRVRRFLTLAGAVSIGGALIGWLAMVPNVLGFLMEISPSAGIQPMVRVSDYVHLLTPLVLAPAAAGVALTALVFVIRWRPAPAAPDTRRESIQYLSLGWGIAAVLGAVLRVGPNPLFSGFGLLVGGLALRLAGAKAKPFALAGLIASAAALLAGLLPAFGLY